MREIKFRVWDNEENNFWGEGRSLSLVSIVSDSVVNDDSTVLEQYTGLKDKNGVEIYENDIVETTYYNDIDDGLGKIGTITFEKGGYCIIFVGDTEKNNLGWIEPDETIVIGNIHENPELLEKQS
ncbi:MAG: YopX family protein [Leuconostoc mesenteroides]